MLRRLLVCLLIVLALPALACNLTSPPATDAAPPAGDPADDAPADTDPAEDEPGNAPAVTATPTDLPTATPTPTEVDLGIVPSPTPTQTPPPTATPRPTATPAATRIRFTQGSTFTQLDGQGIAPGGAVNYVLEAAADQEMTVTVDMPLASGADLSLRITGADGTVLAATGYGATPSWRGTVPRTQDYFLTVQNRGGQGGFTLYVSIPQRVRFASGATSTVIEGTVPAQGMAQYVLEAAADQVMFVTLSGQTDVWLSVVSSDGIPYLRADWRENYWFGPLPTTQDYYVYVYGDAPGTTYALTVSIPRRVRFAAGTTSTTVSGTFGDQYSVDYVLEAGAGQTMNVDIASANDDVLLTIVGLDGNPLIRYQSGATRFSGQLPVTQDYIVRAVRAAVTTSPGYTMTIRVTD